jgi:hypothetical protein
MDLVVFSPSQTSPSSPTLSRNNNRDALSFYSSSLISAETENTLTYTTCNLTVTASGLHNHLHLHFQVIRIAAVTGDVGAFSIYLLSGILFRASLIS